MFTTQLIGYLKGAGRIDDAQEAELHAIAAKGDGLEETLIDRKLLTHEELLRVRGSILGLPVVSLVGRTIPSPVLEILPRMLAERYLATVFEREGDRVTVGLVHPADQHVVEAIEFYAREQGLRVRYAVISDASFRAALRQYSDVQAAAAHVIADATERFSDEAVVPKAEGEVDLVAEIERAPVSQIVTTLIRHALELNASDIHLEPYGKETRIRYRVDGVLQTTLTVPLTLHAALVSRVKVLAKMKLDESRIPQDGRIHITEGGRDVDLRVSTIPLLEHEKVVMRILESSASLITLQDLGFRPWQIEVINRSVHRPNGMVLLTGPTGSGKSTTLYAVLNLLNAEGVNITTLEDPIEYYVRGVNQAQIHPDVGFTFATGLRAVLRQDPNVIMVGEIRDVETAELSVHAALTGHLLFSTLHTRDVLGVVPRLTDMKIEPFLLSSTLIMAEGQRLVRKICSDCSERFQPATEVVAQITRTLASFPAKSVPAELTASGISLSRGRGCGKCGGTGYRGRTVAVEILEFDAEFHALIVRGFARDHVEALVKERGMVNIAQDALLKALEGHTTYEEVLRISHE